MIEIQRVNEDLKNRPATVKKWLSTPTNRLGLITSIDGKQLITLLLDPENRKAVCLESPVEGKSYHSLTPRIPLCHWQERICWDMFGLVPEGHPRLKPVLLHKPYELDFFPLRGENGANHSEVRHEMRSHKFMEVKGEGVYEIPVGPIHAGVIEPGHFRFSCLGEVILNLEIHLGYVHRGVEKKIKEVPWHKTRFVAESAATDSVAAYALANAQCLESMLGIQPTLTGIKSRMMALEIERVAMHIADLIGFAADIGYLGVAANFSRLRGSALRLADLLSGSRFMKGFIRPGGVVRATPRKNLVQIQENAKKLATEVSTLAKMLLDNQAAIERMSNIGKVSNAIGKNFGLVGVAGRACGIEYDARVWSERIPDFSISCRNSGDVLARAQVRVDEILVSLNSIAHMAEGEQADEPPYAAYPDELPKNAIGLGIVEGHRGELIHLAFTDDEGKLSRYAIKDPSVNNWTALAIAIRNNLVADFPLCNKSFSLAYSGHDL